MNSNLIDTQKVSTCAYSKPCARREVYALISILDNEIKNSTCWVHRLTSALGTVMSRGLT